MAQAYAPTSSLGDKLVEILYDGFESAMNKVKTQYTVLMGDFNAKVGKEQAGDEAVREYRISSRKKESC